MALKLKTKLNKGLIVDTLIASIISDYAPAIINKFLFSNNPLSGMSLQIASAGAGYVAGALMKKPNVASISIALAGSNLVGGMVGQVVTPLLGSGSVKSGTAKATVVSDYFALNDFVSAPRKSMAYASYYE